MSYCHESAPNHKPLRPEQRKRSDDAFQDETDEKCYGRVDQSHHFANGFKWLDHPSLHIGSCRKPIGNPTFEFLFPPAFYSAAFVLSGCGAVGCRPCFIYHQKCFWFCEFSQRWEIRQFWWEIKLLNPFYDGNNWWEIKIVNKWHDPQISEFPIFLTIRELYWIYFDPLTIRSLKNYIESFGAIISHDGSMEKWYIYLLIYH